LLGNVAVPDVLVTARKSAYPVPPLVLAALTTIPVPVVVAGAYVITTLPPTVRLLREVLITAAVALALVK
jgi:hypothetical protein